MNNVADMLKELVIVNLGAAGDRDLVISEGLASITTLVEIDALDKSRTTKTYRRRIRLASVVSDKPGPQPFYSRAYRMCSSLLQADPVLAAAYGLEEFVRTEAETVVQCSTVAQMLADNCLDRADFLKTDLEGMDARAIVTAIDDGCGTLAVQSELRFEPFYLGKPYCHDAVRDMYSRGYDLITLNPFDWKYITPHSTQMRRSRVTYGDCIFFLRPQSVVERWGSKAGCIFDKQVVIATMLGLDNLAEWLVQERCGERDSDIQNELVYAILSTGGTGTFASRVADRVAQIPFGSFALSVLCRVLGWVQRTFCTSGSMKHLAYD